MKTNLRRIEATMQQLETINTASYPKPVASRNRTYSFEIRSAAQKRNAPDKTVGEGKLLPSTLCVQTFPAKQSSGKAPTLPKFKSSSFSSHPQVASSALAMKLLPEIQTDVAAYEAELQQIVRQIQGIYLEGPIVDGWLESHPRALEPKAATLPHESVEHLIDYMEEDCSFEQGKVTCQSPRAGYRLCGVDAAGQKWSRNCPLEQLPSVSIAIARYQKLRQLLERKQYLQTRLSQMKGARGSQSRAGVSPPSPEGTPSPPVERTGVEG